MKRIKYPKTLHLPWSENITSDDKVLYSIDHFVGKQVVVSQKMDGENFNILRDFYHARSLTDGALTPKQAWSREWIKKLWGDIRYEIPLDMRIIGENLFATHSIEYYNLPTYAFVFSIMKDDIFLSWDETVEWCELLGLEHVPVLYEGIWDENIIKSLYPVKSDWSNEIEGYVVRIRDSFHIDDFVSSIAKFVRKNHIQTDETWFKGEWVANKLKEK